MTEQTEQADKGWMQAKYTQEEVGYTDYAVRRNPVNSVCQTCRWFIGHDPDMNGASNCHIVECYPLDIVGTGYCNEWTARKVMEPEPLEVVIVTEDEEMDSEEMEMGMMARYGVDVAPVVADFVQKRRLLPDKVESAFKILSSGKWIAYFTNNFLDTDQEILRAKAHEDYVARANAGLVEMPELWRGHIKGTRHGQAERLYLLKTGDAVTVFAIGSFDDTPAGKAAQQFYRKAKPGSVSLSHGFMFPAWAKQDGEYKVYNTFEITTLRRGQEANQFTSFSAKGKDMPLTNGQIEDLKAVYGDAAPEILDNVAKKQIIEIRKAYKSEQYGALEAGLDTLDDLANGAILYYETEREIKDDIERRRKLVETEQKISLQGERAISAESVMLLMAQVLDVIKSVVTDDRQRFAIATGLQQLISVGQSAQESD